MDESLPSRGAWIEMRPMTITGYLRLSLPSRGAWIEMSELGKIRFPGDVAPLTGSVDRNFSGFGITAYPSRSLPSRGAWIEMLLQRSVGAQYIVAPLTGSVDRNLSPGASIASAGGRSPHGERG